MAFDTSFNITWNQRVNKEETSLLKFLDQRKRDGLDPGLGEKASKKSGARRSLSDADLMSAIRSERESNAGSAVGASKSRSRRQASESDLNRRRSGGSGASGSRLQDAGSSISSPSMGGRKKAPPMTFEQMQEHVFTQSMNRYITDLGKEAKEAAIQNDWDKQKIKDGMQQEADEKQKARRLEQENGRIVQQQIEENKHRRASTRKGFVEAASAHNFPLFTETFISQDEVEQYRKDVKKNFREELDRTNLQQQTLKNMLIKKDQIYAAHKMETTIKKMQQDHAFDHHEKRRKGDEMMRVWDRDIRLKNIKNAILSGKDATKDMEAAHQPQ